MKSNPPPSKSRETSFLGIRVYSSDKERWQKIVKRSDKTARAIFNEMLNIYERHIILWDND